MGQPVSIAERIKRIYDERRLKSEYELSERKKAVAEKLPGMKETEDEIISTSMNYGRALIKAGGDKEKKAELSKKYKEQMLDLRLKKSRMLREAGYPADYLDMTYVCEKCLDTGFVDNEKCDCYRKIESDMLFEGSNLGDWLKTNNFSCLSREYYDGEDLKHFDEAVETCHNFINNFNSDYRNLLIYGTVGTGKSFLTGCIVKELMEHSCKVVYYSAIQLFQTISSYLFDKDKALITELNQTLYESDLLVIDDLGSEMTNDFVRSQLFGILNERIIRQKSTIITTNFSYENLREKYQERIFSRIIKEFEPVKLSGRDIRMITRLE